MTGYEKQMYERDLPGIRIALESIAESLKGIKQEMEVAEPIEHDRKTQYHRASAIYYIQRVWKDTETINFHPETFTNFKLVLKEAKKQLFCGLFDRVEIVHKKNNHHEIIRTFKTK